MVNLMVSNTDLRQGTHIVSSQYIVVEVLEEEVEDEGTPDGDVVEYSPV